MSGERKRSSPGTKEPRRAQKSVHGRVRTASTEPELTLRRWLRSNGFSYRVNVATLPGRPDVVLAQHNTVIFVHGCFWHGHKKCPQFRWPKSNAAFWKEKIRRNQLRDLANVTELKLRGWFVHVIWECETTSEALLLRLAASLLRRRRSKKSGVPKASHTGTPVTSTVSQTPRPRRAVHRLP